MAKLNDDGHEVLDTTPVALPVRLRRMDTEAERYRQIIREELSRYADSQGHETFEEADDFEVGDDFDPRSRYEIDDGDLHYDFRVDPKYQDEAKSDKERIGKSADEAKPATKPSERSIEGGKGTSEEAS